MDLIGETINSKATNLEGVITGIGKNGVQVSFTNGLSSILIPFGRFNDLLEANDAVKNYVKEYKELNRKQEGKQ